MADQIADNLVQGTEPAPTPVAQPEAQPAQPAQIPAQEVGGEPGAPQIPLSEWIGQFMANQGAAPQPEPGTVPAQDPPPEPQLILGKFRSQDDLARAYQEAERKMHETGQTLSQYERELQIYRQMQGNQPDQAPAMGQPGEPQQPQTQVKQALDEMSPEQQQEWLEKFYDKPVDAIMELVQPRLQQAVEPVTQRLQQRDQQEVWNRQISDVQRNHGDFNTLVPEIEKAMSDPNNAYIASAPNPFEAAYNLVKSRQVLSQGQPPSAPQAPETLLHDPAFRQKIMQDPAIRNEILKNYAQGVRQGQAPVVIGSQPGGQPPAAPTEPILSTKDATKQAKGFFTRMIQGGN